MLQYAGPRTCIAQVIVHSGNAIKSVWLMLFRRSSKDKPVAANGRSHSASDDSIVAETSAWAEYHVAASTTRAQSRYVEARLPWKKALRLE